MKTQIAALSGTLLEKTFNENFPKAAAKCFFFWGDQNKTDEMSKALRGSLPETIDEHAEYQICTMLSDGFFKYPMHKFVKLASKFTDVYYYESMGKLSFFLSNFQIITKFASYDTGHYHSSDLNLVSCYKSCDDPMVQRMTKMIESFAATG